MTYKPGEKLVNSDNPKTVKMMEVAENFVGIIIIIFKYLKENKNIGEK